MSDLRFRVRECIPTIPALFVTPGGRPGSMSPPDEPVGIRKPLLSLEKLDLMQKWILGPRAPRRASQR